MPATQSSSTRAPHDVAVALDDGVRPAELVRLVRVERGMNAAEHDRGAAPGRPADLVAAQGVAGVNADADDVARLDRRVERLERFVDEDGIAISARRRGREHVQPARRDDADAERHVAGVDEVDDHMGLDVILNPCQVDVSLLLEPASSA